MIIYNNNSPESGHKKTHLNIKPIYDKPTANIICCCFSVAQLYLTLCDPMDCSKPGFPVLHYSLKFAQTHVQPNTQE